MLAATALGKRWFESTRFHVGSVASTRRRKLVGVVALMIEKTMMKIREDGLGFHSKKSPLLSTL